jgi:hypothetical protein
MSAAKPPGGKRRVVIWGQEHWVDDSGIDPDILKKFFDVRPEEGTDSDDAPRV